MAEPNLGGAIGGVWATAGIDFDTKSVTAFENAFKSLTKTIDDFLERFDKFEQYGTKADRLFSKIKEAGGAANRAMGPARGGRGGGGPGREDGTYSPFSGFPRVSDMSGKAMASAQDMDSAAAGPAGLAAFRRISSTAALPGRDRDPSYPGRPGEGRNPLFDTVSSMATSGRGIGGLLGAGRGAGVAARSTAMSSMGSVLSAAGPEGMLLGAVLGAASAGGGGRNPPVMNALTGQWAAQTVLSMPSRISNMARQSLATGVQFQNAAQAAMVSTGTFGAGRMRQLGRGLAGVYGIQGAGDAAAGVGAIGRTTGLTPEEILSSRGGFRRQLEDVIARGRGTVGAGTAGQALGSYFSPLAMRNLRVMLGMQFNRESPPQVGEAALRTAQRTFGNFTNRSARDQRRAAQDPQLRQNLETLGLSPEAAEAEVQALQSRIALGGRRGVAGRQDFSMSRRDRDRLGIGSSPGEAFRDLRNQMTRLKDIIGSALAPILTKGVRLLTGFFGRVEQGIHLMGRVAGALGDAWNRLRNLPGVKQVVDLAEKGVRAVTAPGRAVVNWIAGGQQGPSGGGGGKGKSPGPNTSMGDYLSKTYGIGGDAGHHMAIGGSGTPTQATEGKGGPIGGPNDQVVGVTPQAAGFTGMFFSAKNFFNAGGDERLAMMQQQVRARIASQILLSGGTPGAPATPSTPTGPTQPVAPGASPVGVTSFLMALREQETGNNPNAYNWGTGPGAKGAYQIMPDNWPSWAKQAGVDPADKSPSAQDKVARFKINEYYQMTGSFESAAAMWHAGPRGADPSYNPVDQHGTPGTPGYFRLHTRTAQPGDTGPAYVPSVMEKYNKYKGQGFGGPSGGGIVIQRLELNFNIQEVLTEQARDQLANKVKAVLSEESIIEMVRSN